MTGLNTLDFYSIGATSTRKSDFTMAGIPATRSVAEPHGRATDASAIPARSAASQASKAADYLLSFLSGEGHAAARLPTGGGVMRVRRLPRAYRARRDAPGLRGLRRPEEEG